MGKLYEQLKKIKSFFKSDDKKNQLPIENFRSDDFNLKKTSLKNSNSINVSTRGNLKVSIPVKEVIKNSTNLVDLELKPLILNKSPLTEEINSNTFLEKKLYRKHFFKFPEPWVAKGGNTQISDNNVNSFIDIYIGIDFGTSFTKAAIGLMDKVYPVDWQGISNFELRYLLPSEYCRFPDNSVFIGQHPEADSTSFKSDLKLPFINQKNPSTEEIEQASIFLALITRYIRAWTYHNFSNLVDKKNIRWHLNIGAPSNGLEDTKLKTTYLNLCKYAWDISNLESSHLVGKSNLNNHFEGLDLSSFEVFPEFVAQMAGYMQSSQRIPGLHALIDVGGGTLDVVTYIVHQDEEKEDVFPFLVPKVEPLGTQMLNIKRFEIKEVREQKLEIDELSPILDTSSFAKVASVSSEIVAKVDDDFSEKISQLITSVFSKTKNRRYRLSNAWETGVRTFFTGGGSNSTLYLNAIQKAKSQSKGGLILTLLPKHPKLDKFIGDDRDYQRISVACGLAQDSLNLGKVRPAKEVKDDIPKYHAQTIRERLDRDDLYAK